MRCWSPPLFALIVLALALGCTGGSVGSPAVRIEPTAAATAATASPATATPATTSTLTPTPRPAETATPAVVQGAGHPLSALSGSPLDGHAFWRALEAQALTVGPGDLHHECDDLGWPRSAWYATRGSVDESQVFLLWVYPDREALRADWTARPGAAPSPADERCVIESGWQYWNENMVLVFGTVVDDALRRAVVEAFLGLSR